MLNRSVITKNPSKEHFSSLAGKRLLQSNSQINNVISGFQHANNRVTADNQLTGLSSLWRKPIFRGINLEDFPQISIQQLNSKPSQTIHFNGIELTSRFENQPIIIDGILDISIMPTDKTLDITNLTRLIRFLAERPQKQHRLTQQIMLCLQALLNTEDVSVSIDAILFSAKSQIMTEAESGPVTVAMGGQFDISKTPTTTPSLVSPNP